MDCIEFMQSVPDKFYDLAIVDPPYGINADNKNNGENSKNHLKNSKAKINKYKVGWDNEIPNQNYFTQLQRISKKQIIWGGNYFGLSGGFLFWNKNVTMPTYSQGELAWISWSNKIDYIEFTWHGMVQNDMKNKENRIHPTQKPVKLYEWLLMNYAKEGDKILDTHGGSQSSRIACFNLGFELDIIELDKDYFDAGNKRFDQHKKQLTLF